MTLAPCRLATPALIALLTLVASGLAACGGGGGSAAPGPAAVAPGPTGQVGIGADGIGADGISAGIGEDPAPPAEGSGVISGGPPAPGIEPLQGVRVSAASVQAEPNAIYLADRADAGPVTVRLPVSLAVGDTVTVTGVGAAGWRLAQNDGQVILTDRLPDDPALGARWLESGPAADWWTAAASGDGRLLAVAVNFGSIYFSRDDGATWQAQAGPGEANWSSIDMDPSGTHLVASAFGGPVWVSHDGGASWTPTFHACNWLGVTISNDGQRLAAVAKYGPVSTSDDGGQTWTQRLPYGNWQAIAGSEDGRILITAAIDEPLQVSTDHGQTWTPRELPRHWYRMAVSADGQRMAAADSGGWVYLSEDSGRTWTPRFREGPVTELSMSRDGMQLAVSVPRMAGVAEPGVFHSTDGGLSWQAVRGDGVWRAAALAGDGRTLLAGALADGSDPWVIAPGRAGGRIQVSRGHRTRFGADGGLAGGAGDRVEVTYREEGRFEVTRSEGATLRAD